MSKLFKYFGTTAQKGDYLFKEGEEADYLYLIHKGRVKISRMISNNVEEIIKVLEEGEFVGEMAVIDSLPRSADAIALEECQLIRMDKLSFDASIRENHQFAVTFIQFLSQRLRNTNEGVTSLTIKNLTQALYIEILLQLHRSGKTDHTGKWRLIKLNSFLKQFKAQYSIDNDSVMSGLSFLSERKKIKLRKDSKNTMWIALDLSN
ncbi:MAG: Crp/Fnr family transcriptional regulator [bacterium]|nr:Crp/Fnr family transcriptional regulator [bacterium]